TDVCRLQPLGPLLHLELDLLTLGKRAKAFRLDGGVMAEDVGTSVILHDEPEPLRIVEPLHGTSDHFVCFFPRSMRQRAAGAASCSGRMCSGSAGGSQSAMHRNFDTLRAEITLGGGRWVTTRSTSRRS